MKIISITLALVFSCSAALAEEEGGEHKAPPPPKPSPSSPAGQVYNLPVVTQWRSWMEAHGAIMSVSGESISYPDGHECYGVVVGEEQHDGIHSWRRFCVTKFGGDIYVASVPLHPMDDITYLQYDKWVSKCEPTENSSGSC